MSEELAEKIEDLEDEIRGLKYEIEEKDSEIEDWKEEVDDLREELDEEKHKHVVKVEELEQEILHREQRIAELERISQELKRISEELESELEKRPIVYCYRNKHGELARHFGSRSLALWAKPEDQTPTNPDLDWKIEVYTGDRPLLPTGTHLIWIGKSKFIQGRNHEQY